MNHVMNSNRMATNNQSSIINYQSKAFSLIEVIAALAITGIALVGLMRLHLASACAAENAEAKTQAILLAQAKLDALIAGNGTLSEGLSGSEVCGTFPYHWQASVTEEHAPGLAVGRPPRRLRVRVWWDHGIGHRQMELGSYLPRE